MVGTRGEVDPAAKLPIIAKRPAAQPTLMLSICGFWCFESAAGKGRNVDAEKPRIDSRVQKKLSSEDWLIWSTAIKTSKSLRFGDPKYHVLA